MSRAGTFWCRLAWIPRVVLLLALAAPVRGIDPDLPFAELVQAQWRQDAGLAQDTVYTLEQTRDGFLWIGTRGGLSRFDGVRFRNFGRAELRLEKSTRVQALKEDTAGALWIGTGSGELLRYQDGEFRSYGPADGLIAEGRPVGRIVGFAVGKAGEFWVGTHSNGVFRRQGERFEKIDTAPLLSPITRLAVDEDGDLWISTIGSGVLRLRSGQPHLHLTSRDGLPNDFVGGIIAARGGGVYMATHSGICRYKNSRFEVWGKEAGLEYPHTTAIREDRNGNVFFATFGGGLHRLRPDGVLEKPRPGKWGWNDLAWDIFEDHSGMIWLGTVDQGLRLFAQGSFATWQAHGGPRELGSRLVTVVREDVDGTWWIGTRNNGLHWRRNGVFGHSIFGHIGRAQGLAADTIWSLARGSDSLWVGTDRGLYRVFSDRAEAVPLPFSSPQPAILSLELEGYLLWVGTARGLVRLGAGETPPRIFGFDAAQPAPRIHDIERDRQGNLFVATSTGLARLEEESLRLVAEFDFANSGEPLALHLDSGGALWVLTASRLARLGPGGIKTLGPADGLPADGLYGLVEDAQANFWLGTSSGIVRVSRAALTARLAGELVLLPLARYGRFDGIEPGAIEGFGKRAQLGRDERVHFPTFGGVAIFDPAQLRAAAAPAALIDSVDIDGVPLGRGETANLQGNRHQLVFHLSAPLPHAGSQVQMRYRLLGVDPDWIEADASRQATYSGLLPGRYVFEAQASTTAGVYLSQPARFTFEVRAGFFQSWRFPAVLTLALAAGIWLFHLGRARQILENGRELDRRIAKATADIQALHGLLPICGSCHKVRDDRGYWQQVETFLAQSTELKLTHSFCPDCAARLLEEMDETPQSRHIG